MDPGKEQQDDLVVVVAEPASVLVEAPVHTYNSVYDKYQQTPLQTSNNQRLRSAGRKRSKVKRLLLHCCALRMFHVKDSQNTRDQIKSERRSKRA